MRKRVTAFVILGLCLAPAAGWCQFGGVTYCTNCSDEITMIAMKAQQVLQYLKEVQIALAALQVVQMMTREGKNLVTHPSTNIASDIGTLQMILMQSQGLAGDMAQMDATFRKIYAPYSMNPSPLITYASAYNQWATTTLKTIYGSASVAGMQNSMLLNEQGFMAQVQSMNQTAFGQDQLIQLGNAIGTEEVSQLQKLRVLMIADMSSKEAFMAQQTNTQQAQQASEQANFTHAHWVGDGKSW